ncbi:hypothetical protein F5X68DRAFT_252378 [Plectosphaerella plurivora]|uniref:Uncharacterized protein n=1 Tax=Plectosphaerella plurivora TaxID=936078 RepID=A0A9P8VFB1_9PEZI|nr:hypothetical protein F5X68DRAFT_252378 [Plectosphaerella plurivora]
MFPFSNFTTMQRNGHRNGRGRASSPTLNMDGPLSLSLIPLSVVGLLIGLVLFLGQTDASPIQCQTDDQANILHDLFPNNATGNFNATIVVIPITLDLARKIIPSSYKILEAAYRSLLPDFPADSYPVIIQAGHDHDIRYMEYSIPDFSRVGFEFPFLDLLGDGFSSFKWAPEQMITASNPDAISGSREYGTVVYPSTFEPECNAYARDGDGTYFRAQSDLAHIALSYTASQSPSCGKGVIPIDFFKNVTNQPIFVNGSSCCDHTRIYDTPLSLGQHAPVRIQASIEAKLGPFGTPTKFDGVQGIQVMAPFIENNYVSCESLKGDRPAPPVPQIQMLRQRGL